MHRREEEKPPRTAKAKRGRGGRGLETASSRERERERERERIMAILRKRKANDREKRRRDDMEEFLGLASKCSNIVVFSGSGMSVASGLSTFTSRGGLYERATKKFKVADGMKLFSNGFYAKYPKKCLSFLSEIFLEARQTKPNQSHEALAKLEDEGRLLRHYTMNIDGLMRFTSASHWTRQPDCPGKTVELHGNCRETVCTNCGKVSAMSVGNAKSWRSGKDVFCRACSKLLRPKIMLYDDADSELITPDVVMEVMDEDVSKADLILWIGISFQQSASLEYFRNILRVIKEFGKEGTIVQGLINPDEDSSFNALTGSNNIDDFKVISLVSQCEPVLDQIVAG